MSKKKKIIPPEVNMKFFTNFTDYAKRAPHVWVGALAVLGAVYVLPQPAIRGLVSVPPNILGLTLQDFVTWVLASGVVGAVIAAILANVNKFFSSLGWTISTNWLNTVESTIVVALTAGIAQAVKFVSPDLLGLPIGQLIILAVGTLVTWTGAKFTERTVL